MEESNFPNIPTELSSKYKSPRLAERSFVEDVLSIPLIFLTVHGTFIAFGFSQFIVEFMRLWSDPRLGNA